VNKKQSRKRAVKGFLAERVGFEPTVTHWATTVFETVPFNHSGTSPNSVAIISCITKLVYKEDKQQEKNL
jgi:hypothetical protein